MSIIWRVLLCIFCAIYVQSCVYERVADRDIDSEELLRRISNAIGVESAWIVDADGPVSEEALIAGIVIDLYVRPRPLGSSACTTTLYNFRAIQNGRDIEYVHEEGITVVSQLAMKECSDVQVDDFNPIFDSVSPTTVVFAYDYLTKVFSCVDEDCYQELNATFESQAIRDYLPKRSHAFNWEVHADRADIVTITFLLVVEEEFLLTVDISGVGEGDREIHSRFYLQDFNVE